MAGKRLIVNVDGGSRGNPGPAAIAAVVRSEGGEVLEEWAETIGEATNNVAEYRALLLGIELAKRHGADAVKLIGDSQLVVRQVQGEYKVKDAALKSLHAKVTRELGELEKWSIDSVPRDENAGADALLNDALDAAS